MVHEHLLCSVPHTVGSFTHSLIKSYEVDQCLLLQRGKQHPGSLSDLPQDSQWENAGMGVLALACLNPKVVVFYDARGTADIRAGNLQSTRSDLCQRFAL